MKPGLQPPSTVALTWATAVVALLAALLLGLVAPAWADPMRPLVPPPAASAAAPLSTPAAAAAANGAPWPVLRALRQDSEGRHQALLGERWVRVGDRLDGPDAPPAQPPTIVAAIDGQRVQLRQHRQTHTLHLLPPLRYSAAAASAPTPSPPGSQRAPGR